MRRSRNHAKGGCQVTSLQGLLRNLLLRGLCPRCPPNLVGQISVLSWTIDRCGSLSLYLLHTRCLAKYVSRTDFVVSFIVAASSAATGCDRSAVVAGLKNLP